MRCITEIVVLVLLVAGCSQDRDSGPTWEDASVVAITATSDGMVWLGAADGSLMRVGGGRRERMAAPSSSDPIRAIVPQGTGVIVAAGSGTFRHDGGAWSGPTQACPGCAVTAVGARSGIVAGMETATGHGFIARDGTRTELHEVVPVVPSASAIIDVAEGPAGLWVATAAAGVVWSDGSSWRLHSLQTGSLRDDRVFDVALDDRGGLWVATQLGVTRLTTGGHSHIPLDVLPDRRVRSLAVTAEFVWVGTFEGGIARLDLRSGRWAILVPARPGAAAVTTLAPDAAGVWAGTDGDGLVHVGGDGTSARFVAPGALTDGRVTALHVTPGGEVWAGTPGGLALHITAAGAQQVEVAVGVRPLRGEDDAVGLDADLVSIPPGRFLMGSDHDRGDEAPQRTVTLAGFRIHRCEVTNAQYARFVSATGAPRPAAWPAGRIPPGEALHPVVGVRAEEAAGYCEWLGMRLPTEAEWERAARGTDGRTWPWGNTWDPARANTAASGMGWTTPVGAHPSGGSPDGVLDMAGNVAEWVADYYDAAYYAVGPDTDPPGPRVVTNRVRRGGSWAAGPDEARTSHRASSHGSSPDLRAGFRCAVSGS